MMKTRIYKVSGGKLIEGDLLKKKPGGHWEVLVNGKVEKGRSTKWSSDPLAVVEKRIDLLCIWTSSRWKAGKWGPPDFEYLDDLAELIQIRRVLISKNNIGMDVGREIASVNW